MRINQLAARDGIRLYSIAWRETKSHWGPFFVAFVLLMLTLVVGRIPIWGTALETTLQSILGCGVLIMCQRYDGRKELNLKFIFQVFSDANLFKRLAPYFVVCFFWGLFVSLSLILMHGHPGVSKVIFLVYPIFLPFGLMIHITGAVMTLASRSLGNAICVAALAILKNWRAQLMALIPPVTLMMFLLTPMLLIVFAPKLMLVVFPTRTSIQVLFVFVMIGLIASLFVFSAMLVYLPYTWYRAFFIDSPVESVRPHLRSTRKENTS